MNDIDLLVDRYLAAWNEVDAEARRELIAATFTEQVTYIDPLTEITGRALLNTVIEAARAQFAGLVFSRGGAVDAHHDVARFTWGLGLPGEEPVVVGFDVVTIDDGRISQVHGFLDKVPVA
jgi:hypothetical protein